MTEAMGIDVGGSGIKGAVVDTASGELLTERFRVATPSPSTPRAVAKAAARLVARAHWEGPLGCTVPSVVHRGVVHTAANIAPSWIGIDAAALLHQATGLPTVVVNDADAAGVAEMRAGAGRGRGGVVLLLTFGTGIGSALFVDGHLVPNTELGHLQMWGGSAEVKAAAQAKTRESLSWAKWARRVDKYLAYVERLFSPDLLIVGGGVSRDYHRWVPLLRSRAEIVPARFRNNAGIVGAALLAAGGDPAGPASGNGDQAAG
ncbi:MAG: ROK family protein [Acidimicrobiia bacterium]|nr:ROK family protein [Acidimicrobiia bacterium]